MFYDDDVTEATETMSYISPGSHRQHAPAWYLVVAFDCMRPLAPPSRISLDGVEEIIVGRGAERRWEREENGRRLRLDLPDRWMSGVHFRLVREGAAHWQLTDEGSKNGTLVAGTTVSTCLVEDGALIESGATMMVLRRITGVRPPGDVRASDAEPPVLRTLHAPLEQTYDLLVQVARSTVPLLVTGETGTGKELVARAIHSLSGRKGQFLAVNCGALPPNLIEGELFGSKKGAYSGAVEDRQGLVRAASGGTLFLDEIAELPLQSQATLLRVLQEGEVLAIGATAPVKVDLRVVAATHQDLPDLAAKGQFRQDLLARVKGHIVALPPLRSRREDLGLLIGALLARIEPNGEGRTFQRAAARALFRYEFRENVRELEHLLRTGVAVARVGELGLEHLPDLTREQTNNTRPSSAPAGEPAAPRPADPKAHLVALLERHSGNVSAVARDLQTSRSHVRRLAARYAVDLEAFRK
jgi:DNA-binding NtrC family response regulator